MRIAFQVIMLVLAGAAAAEEPWKLLKPDGLGFSVEMPVGPSASEQDVDIGEEQSAKMRVYQIISGGVIYDLTLADYPAGTVRSIGVEKMLDNARDGAMRNTQGPLISETKIVVVGQPARELIVDMPMGTRLRCRLFTVGDRLFNIGAITKKGNETAPEIEKFLASFQLADLKAR